jgi:hypothetical protein
VGSLNLCLRKPDSMQKESVQSNNPLRRKGPKCEKILGYFDIGPNIKIQPHFGHFLEAGWTDWPDFFCNVSGSFRHKFRLPTTYYYENVESPRFFRVTSFGGPPKIILDEKKIVSQFSLIYWSLIRYLL